MSIRLKIQSFVANSIYWTVHPYLYRWAKGYMDFEADKLKTFNDVQTFQSRFKYTADKWFDWRPWVITFFARDMFGDCDDASIAGQWALQQIGVESHILSLRDSTGEHDGHAICVSNDNETTIMISNDRIVRFKSDDYCAFILRWFDYLYDTIKLND